MNYKFQKTDPRFKNTEYIIEATHYEQNSLWKEWHFDVDWVQKSGLLVEVGRVVVGDQEWPVIITVFWDNINGHSVAFWEPTSQVVVYPMIKDWWEERCPTTKKTDVSNFHLCLEHCGGTDGS